MTHEIIIAGFGGQGVLSLGKILAYAGIMQDKEVSWMPSYGPEMRGGTANVTLILSDDKISSPYLKLYDIVIALNQQSIDKFEDTVKPGGVLLYDTNGISTHPTREDINIYKIDGSKLASSLGSNKIYNMVILGGLLKIEPILEEENILKGMKKSLPERYHHLIPLNQEAIKLGMNNCHPVNVAKTAIT